MTQSRFVNLTSYCIVEYMFEPLGSSNFLNDDVVLIDNKKADIFQIFNTDASFNTTRNIQDLTAIPIGGNKVAYADSEKVPNYIDYDSDMVEIPVNGYNVVYDRVRFHFIAGFDFEGFQALILSIRNRQNDGEKHIFANILLAPDTIGEVITFNSKPLFLSDSLYDRYVDVLVPSIKNINEEYNTALNPATTFVAAITPTDTGSTGFVTNAPIQITLSECGRKEKLATNINDVQYDIYEITENYDASLSQTNEFDNVGAYINESTTGDFIEYYMTWNSGFPEELISILNRRNPSDDWVIIHQLSVFEQVGSTFINTTRQIIFQEDSWDEPLVFRPVLKNAGSAVSMSIDLLTRLTNRRNGEQIIREGSFTLLSPKKYGKKLNVIPLADEPQSQKVYNKIIKKNFESTKLFIEPTFAPGFEGDPQAPAQIVNSIEYIPIFFSNNNISVSNNSGNVKTTDKDDEIIFGPGKLRFAMSPFDNAIKLRLFNVRNKKPIPLDLNVNGASYRMVFELDSGKVSIEANLNANSSKLSNGQLLFNVSKKDSQRIFESKNQTVYITSVAQDGTETLMYTGEWRRPTQQADITAAINLAKEETTEIENRDAKIAALEAKIKTMQEALNKKTFSIARNRIVKKTAKASIVNSFGMKNPKKIRTEVSNAGKKSKRTVGVQISNKKT